MNGNGEGMTTVTLANGYYIEIDPLNHTLKREYAGMDKQGNEKIFNKTIGYYSDLGQAIKGFIERNQLEDDFKGNLAEYVNSIRESNKMAVRAVQRKLDGE
ncbi:hypothetical protein ACTQ6A_02810 [Lachnospiraceae bacterium LCP25S3_G4]